MATKKPNAQKEITLTLSLDECNTIIEALGQLPFMRVYRIIEKIHIQASSQDNKGLQQAPGKKK